VTDPEIATILHDPNSFSRDRGHCNHQSGKGNRAMSTMTPPEVNALLQGLGPVWVHMAEYRMTHGHLHLLLTDEHCRQVADVYLSDCLHIAGPTSGGPWTCSLREERADTETYLVLSAGGELTIKALRAHASRSTAPGRSS
jgi:hypothetical protein